MCGVFGFFARDGERPPTDRCVRLTALLRHRGPDAGGYWAEGPFFLGHRRLSIIDLSGAHQPMFSEDGKLVVSFNGEIYNYIELREELTERGHRFRTSSDTEVLLAGYREWGTDVASHLVGMFAFAIVDREARTLYLARDRLGEKPLLYLDRPGALVFASEMRPIAATMDDRRLDLPGLAGYLCLNYVPGDRTLMHGVRRLPAASWQLYDSRGLRASARYWTPCRGGTAERPRHDVELLDELQLRLDHAVAFALRSDVPVGLFLSGGIDSSVVAESATRQGLLKQAYCLDMGAGDFSEWAAANEVARRLSLPIERVPFDISVLDGFFDVVEHADDPLADSSALPVWTVSRAAARNLKVVLSGDGGDELFGGYLTYAASSFHGRVARWLPVAVRRLGTAMAPYLPVDDRRKVSATYKAYRFLRALDLDTREAHFTWNGTWLPEEAAALLNDDTAGQLARGALDALAAAHDLPEPPATADLQRADLVEYLTNDILVKVDRMTMAHSLESRAPLLNPDLVDLVLRLPDSAKVTRVGRTKVLLRALCERHFGPELAWTKKKGFSIPIHDWLRSAGRELVSGLLSPVAIEALGVLRPARVREAVADHQAGRRSLGWELWGLMVLSAWHKARVASAPAIPAAIPDDMVERRPMVATNRSEMNC